MKQKTQELEKVLDTGLLYDSDLATDGLIQAYCDYLGIQNWTTLATEHPFKAWALINFFDTANRFDLSYAYENLAMTLIEEEDEKAEQKKRMKKYIIQELEPDYVDFSFYFDDDGLKEASGDYCNTLFIVPTRHSSGLNSEEYHRIQKELDSLLEEVYDIEGPYGDAYSSVGALLLDNGLIKSIKDTRRIKAFKDFFAKDDTWDMDPEAIAEYLTLKTGKEWEVASARGYSQGDYVEGVFCTEAYKDGIQNYLEVWLGRAKEFVIITLDDNGNEIDQCGGYFVAESEAWKPEDIKKLICGWEGIKEEEADLMLIGGADYTTTYHYDTF